jgi:hypothetical protein
MLLFFFGWALLFHGSVYMTLGKAPPSNGVLAVSGLVMVLVSGVGCSVVLVWFWRQQSWSDASPLLLPVGVLMIVLSLSALFTIIG